MLTDSLSIAFFFLIFQSYAAAQQTKTGGYYPADYQIQDSLPIKTPDGAQISAMVVRKKGATEYSFLYHLFWLNGY